jgi:DNA polymerase-1
MSKKIKTILLLDVSHLFFRAFYAFPRNLTDPQKKPINAVFGVAQMLLSVIEKEKPDFIFGGKDLSSKTIRHQEMPEYKGGRPELDDDLRVQIPRVFHFFDALNLPVFHHEGWEADDIIASISEKFRGNEEYHIKILTGDADALQLIGENVQVLKPAKGENELLSREKLFEKKSLYPEEIIDFKAIAGDSSDNLKGIVGIGEKGAVGLIRDFGNLESIYQALEEGKIKGAKAKKLAEGKENAFFTRKMATLHRELPLQEFDTEQGNIQKFSLPNAIDYFQNELGSRSLQTRIKTVLNPYIADKVSEEQGSLF